MQDPKLKVVRFTTQDVIATSVSGVPCTHNNVSHFYVASVTEDFGDYYASGTYYDWESKYSRYSPGQTYDSEIKSTTFADTNVLAGTWYYRSGGDMGGQWIICDPDATHLFITK